MRTCSSGAPVNGIPATVKGWTHTPPAGAATAQLRFRYTGTNSAFWTVDQVSLDR
ncbi:hypothetical protein [Kitasatospora sp. NPDC051914]|uniref:hypothetical protein n=1 Tax=Kitasatospora sp. NPDC051914 TaxID=3154945 RepID=UPI003414CA22